MANQIPFHKPYIPVELLDSFKDTLRLGHLEGNGPNTKQCELEMGALLKHDRVLLTNSCTSALEIAVAISGVGHGDEVILPSFTFVATASAVCRTGAKPVFVDIDRDTLCIDLQCAEKAITKRTKVIMPVHYAGISCDMDQLMQLASEHNIKVIEDAAQGFLCTYKTHQLGTIGDFGCFSFHNTKVFSAGEGGAIVVKNEEDWEKAIIWRDKGTNRQQFFQGKIDKYGWVGSGTNSLMSELNATLLMSQIENRGIILKRREQLFYRYLDAFKNLPRSMVIPSYNTLNYHFFYFLMDGKHQAKEILAFFKEHGINAVQHYSALHCSTYAKENDLLPDYELPVSEDISASIIRLPLFTDMTTKQQNQVIRHSWEFLTSSQL
tara:strand:- start:10411 stop:11547 length:1137 start_codon:yes stop_codon:yes gene_type:complete